MMILPDGADRALLNPALKPLLLIRP
jgi:hypothetical protein